MIKTIATTMRTSLPKANYGETLDVLASVVVPLLAKGIIIRRPKVVALAERLDLNKRAVRRIQRLRNKYGTGPLLLRTPPWWPYALILSPEHVHRVLNNSPEPFATASREKRSALSHFQPKGVLISHGSERADRRRFNEQVLDTHRQMHHLAERFVAVADEEAAHLLTKVRDHGGQLTWDQFAGAWFPMVRRVMLGDTARDDHELTDLINRLRSDANWAFLRPKRTRVRDRFYERLNTYLTRAEPGSLAGVMATTHTTSFSEPAQQVPQWLFASDPAGLATFRTLAVLASHPHHAARVRDEIKNRNAAQHDLPYLRACVLDTLRLWPTTPMVLRQSTAETTWESGVMAAQTGLLIFAPFFHRDDQRLPDANRFAPELWLEHRGTEDWPLIPFSEGPAVCAGQNLVLLLSSAMLAALLTDRQIRLQRPTWLNAQRPLPGTLNPYALRFKLDN